MVFISVAGINKAIGGDESRDGQLVTSVHTVIITAEFQIVYSSQTEKMFSLARYTMTLTEAEFTCPESYKSMAPFHFGNVSFPYKERNSSLQFST